MAFLLRSLLHRADSRKTRPHRRATRKPIFQQLEDRRLLAIVSLPQDIVAAPNDDITVPVVLDSVVDLQSPNRVGSASVVVEYDTAVLTATSVTEGNFGQMTVVGNVITPGVVFFLSFTTSPISGKFADVLANLQFTVNADAPAGASSLNLLSSYSAAFTEVLNENDNPIPLDVPVTAAPNDPVDGRVTIVREPAAEELVQELNLAIHTLLDDSSIADRDAKRLIRRLDRTLRNLERDRPRSAVRQLQNFIKDTNRLVDRGRLGGAAADSLLQTANSAIDAILSDANLLA